MTIFAFMQSPEPPFSPTRPKLWRSADPNQDMGTLVMMGFFYSAVLNFHDTLKKRIYPPCLKKRQIFDCVTREQTPIYF
jgi:hypothetical protein